ncbi:ABC transporter ATP-binding protein [Tessaracoccus sp. OH4464_COT-324]|uniref:ABC transporter ATP-binding protein n=1 Tax=Tessaracoccus sp. OH4464_COT-324 TaxID=2491059 RepID=UPI000F62FEB6|nr:ABC transporter ATP-binding protein [Tessaracoccus sp. OH4464_COT-324]RRD46712.1 ABC transporter ATP-binding protein [Tessaracoccus sp. OH4464_COT-324]
MTTTNLLRLDDLQVTITLRRGQVVPLQGVSLEIAPGETVGIVGESGCGKTMSALAIMGLLPRSGAVSGGGILFGGKDLTKLPPAEARRIRGLEIGMIFQDPLTSLNPTMRIGDQVSEPLRVHRKMRKREAREKAIDILRKVGMPRPEKIVDDYPHQLSGGMRQRVMIAMALVCQPSLLIADEPTTALDVTTQRQILDLIDELKQEFNTAVILVTHDLGVVAGRADRVAVMYAGRIVETARTADIFANPQHQYTRSLIAALPENTTDTREELYSIPGMPPDLREPIVGCPFAPRCPRAQERCRTELPQVVAVADGDDGAHTHACFHPAGEPLERKLTIRPDRDETESRVLCSVRDLHKDYPAMSNGVIRRRVGWVRAVSGVSFDVHEGETLGIVGESGCGKSTLGRVISALEGATSGAVLVGGSDLAKATPGQLKGLRRDVQMMFQDSYAAMDPRMRVDEILSEPLEIQRIGSRLSRAHKVECMVGDIGLSEAALDKYPHEFSGGQLQRVGLARSLVLEPKLVVCDEPVSALDVSVQAQVLNLMRRIQLERDLTYVFISHDLSVVRYMSDRIAVMYLGKIVEIGPASEVAESAKHPYTQALIDAVPVADPQHKPTTQVAITGEPASAIDPPPGCRFKNRCPFATGACDTEPPLAGDSHKVACHFPLR